MKHWTQTRAGKKKLSAVQKARWERFRNGTSPHQELDELKVLEQVLELYAKLPLPAKNYLRSRIA